MSRLKTMKVETPKFKGDLFTPLQAGTKLDELFSAEKGLMPGTVNIVTGDPGVGKTTVLLDHACDLMLKGKKVLFVSAEMNAIDMVGYCKRFPKFNEIPILFLGDFVEENAGDVLYEELEEGYDVVLMDSWAEVIEMMKDSHKGWVSGKSVESELLNSLERYCVGDNNSKKNTAFLIVQQVTKSGQFAGSNRLKHMITAMFHIRFDKESGGRYIHWSKNRRGGDASWLFFNLNGFNKVNWESFQAPNQE